MSAELQRRGIHFTGKDTGRRVAIPAGFSGSLCYSGTQGGRFGGFDGSGVHLTLNGRTTLCGRPVLDEPTVPRTIGPLSCGDKENEVDELQKRADEIYAADRAQDYNHMRDDDADGASRQECSPELDRVTGSTTGARFRLRNDTRPHHHATAHPTPPTRTQHPTSNTTTPKPKATTPHPQTRNQQPTPRTSPVVSAALCVRVCGLVAWFLVMGWLAVVMACVRLVVVSGDGF